MVTKFSEMGLSPEIMRALDEIGFSDATEIQSKAIPVICEGKDVIGKSQTGTGKTLAFGIPAIEMTDGEEKYAQVLILCPTRELAMQANVELKKLTKYTSGIKIAEVYGGAAMDRQIVQLKRANIVVGTPGRVMDHLRRRTLKIENLKMIVLDEADEMLSMGFREDIETILENVESEHQTVLFSATMPQEIMEITEKFQKDPVLVKVESAITVNRIDQSVYRIPAGRKKDALLLLLKYLNPTRSLIFTNTKSMTEELSEFLQENGYQSEALHGDMKQSQRTSVMKGYKSGKVSILIATDVAARGIDVSDIDVVFNFDIPLSAEYYVHRIGRTGRAGKSGTAISLCVSSRQLKDFNAMARSVEAEVELRHLPTSDEMSKMVIKDQVKKISDEIETCPNHYKGVLGYLLAEGYSERDISLALMELLFGEPKVIEEIEEPQDYHRTSRGEKRSYEKGISTATRIRLDVGRAQKVSANHIVAAITEETSLSGSDVGKIDVYRDYSLVTLPEDMVGMTANSLCGKKINGFVVYARPYADVDLRTVSDKKGGRGKSHEGGHDRNRSDKRERGGERRRSSKNRSR